MARNDTRSIRTPPLDRAHLRAGADSWHALANVTVASTLVLAVVVGVLALVESVFSNPMSRVAQRSPSLTDTQSARTSARLRAQLSKLCARRDPASCVTD